MSLKLILGSSGAGKTNYIYSQIIKKSEENPDKNYIIVVPEQFTMETQKDIVELHPRHGVMNIDIVSFNRLAFRIFEELGINRLSILDDTGKTLILRHVIEDNKDRLQLFGDKIKYFGFVEEMKSSISELYQYGVSPDELAEVIEKTKLHKSTAMKLNDIQIIYEAFKNYVKEMSGEDTVYITKEEVLSRLCEAVSESHIIKNSEIYMDGFTGFTPVQNRLISLLLSCSAGVNVTLTISEEECKRLTPSGFVDIKEHELFAMSKTAVNDLMAMAAQAKVDIAQPVIISPSVESRYGSNKVLNHIEEKLFRYGDTEKISIYDGGNEPLEIYSADNSMKEADFVAEKIAAMIMESKGELRYRDIAVVTGDLEGMKRNVNRAFSGRGIPFFMDNKRSLIKNPFVNIIRSILEIADDNFSYESVFAYLKNEMSVLTDEETDILENYVLGCGIKGKKAYAETFKKRYKGLKDEELEACEVIRQKFMLGVGAFFENDLKNMTVKEISDVIRQFVAEQELERRLQESCERFKELEEYSLAAEYSQTFKLVAELFDKLDSLLGEEKLTLREYRRLLDDGFDEIKVGIIPMVMDQVVVGDIQRTRLNHIKVLFVMGVNDGIIPSHGGKPGLLSQNDRNVLKNLNMELSPTAREQGFIQKFYLYLNLTKPSDKLIMTYSLSASDGTALRPSYLIGTIRELFTDLVIKSCNEELQSKVISKSGAFDRVALGIKKYGDEEPNALWRELFSYFAADEKYKTALDRAIAGAFYMNNESILDRTVANALYGDSLGKSITRLEKYAACAYAHFLSYGLKLVERPVYEIKPADMGNIFHEAIELFSRRIVEDNLDFRNISEETRRSIVDEVVRTVAENYGGQVLKSSARNNYMIEKIRRVTDRSAWAILEHIKHGNFNPEDFELTLREGRIDRVDRLATDGDIFVKVIDYKSGSTSFDPVEVDNGLQLQLIYYMDTMVKREKAIHPDKNVEPAGAFYFNIKDPVIDYEESLMDDDELASRLLQEFKMSGAINSREEVIVGLDTDIAVTGKGSDIVRAKFGDIGTDMRMESAAGIMSAGNFEKLIERVKDKVGQMTEEIKSGKIDINPYKKGQYAPCDYCKFKRVCAFDNKQFDNKYRKLNTSGIKELQEKWNVVRKED